MATVGQTFLSLADAYKMENATKDKGVIIEMLAQYNPALTDAHTEECNSGEEHLTSIRTGLPAPTWRKLYQGVQPTKGEVAQVKDSTGMAEDWSEVDCKLVDKQKNPARFRMIEGRAHLEGMSNTVAEYLWYGDQATTPEAFTGLAPRFNDLNAGSGSQIVDGGGTGSDNMSIWFVTWGPEHCHLIYPEGSKGGVNREDKGKQTKELDNGGGLYDVYREKFTWDVGLSLRDYRGCARVANIDVSDLTNDASGNSADIIDLMTDAYYKIKRPGVAKGKTFIYCNQKAQIYFHKQAKNANNVELSLAQVAGEPVVSFLGIPIHRDDNLLETEERVV